MLNFLTLDLNQIDVDHNIFKKRMNEHGQPIDPHEGEKEGVLGSP